MKEYKRKSREDRIKEIHQAAIGIFLKKGYGNTTMEDIVNATTLSKGGLYHYYGSTKEIIFGIMSSGNTNFFSNFKIDKKWNKEEICHYMTEKTVEKSIVPTPERKLYLMFCMEALYDPDFEKLYMQLENEAFCYLKKCIEGCENVRFQPENLMQMFSRIINAILFAQNLFSSPKVLLEQKSFIYDFYYKIISDMLADA